jgi:hypothetical protein
MSGGRIMPFGDSVLLELIKSGFALVLLAITWGFGQSIIAIWDVRKKQRELDIATTAQFQQLYGEFKEIGRLWKIYKRREDATMTYPENTRWELLKRAIAAESKIEAILVKLSTERSLDEGELEQLGLFRQCYQQLREAIRDNEELVFSEYGLEYKFFNNLASHTACLIASGKQTRRLSRDIASQNLKVIAGVRSKHLDKALDKFRALQSNKDKRLTP